MGMSVATIRSRAKYVGNTFSRNVASDSGAYGVTAFNSPSFGFDGECDGTTVTVASGCWQDAHRKINTTNYKQDFYLSGYTGTGGAAAGQQFNYKVSLDSASQNYLPNVLGESKFGNSRNLWVEDFFPNTITNLATSAVTFSNLELGPSSTYRNYTDSWQPLGAQEGPTTPWIVSQIIGNTLHRLFRVILIPDGNNAIN